MTTYAVLRLIVALQSRAAGDDRERGDVPGWVMVTIMSAGLVVAILAVARPALTEAITAAIARVTGAG